MKVVFGIVMLVAVCYCQNDDAYAPVEGEEYDTIKQQQAAQEKEAVTEAPAAPAAPKSNFVYFGRFADDCENDGLYYGDAFSFVICSGNKAFVQPCARGSANHDPANFRERESYEINAFCSVDVRDARPRYFREYPARGLFRRFRNYY